MVWNKWNHKKYYKYCKDNNLNLPVQKYVDNLTKIYHKCSSCGLLYETTPKRNKLGYKCSYCSGKGINNICILWNYCKAINVDLPLKHNNFNSLHDKIYFICSKCSNVYFQQITSHIRQNHGCPICNGSVQKTPKEYYQECKSKGLDLPIEDYINDRTKIKHKCSKGHIYEQTPGKHIRQKQGCPVCSESHGEKYIRNYLDKSNIRYESQKRFHDLKDKTYLSYDFYLPDYNILIEYQGIQHYESINFRGNGKYSNLEKQQKHDNLKRNYAKENGYKLLELKYTLDTQDKVENYINNELLI